MLELARLMGQHDVCTSSELYFTCTVVLLQVETRGCCILMLDLACLMGQHEVCTSSELYSYRWRPVGVVS